MERKTNLALDCHTIELLINEAKAMGDVGEFCIRKFLKPVLEARQKEGADVAPLLRTINDYLRTFHIRELQALDGNKLTEATCRQRMREVLLAMEKERVIRWKYDYAWIYLTIMVTKELPLSYDSTDSFLGEMHGLGLQRVPTRTLFERMLKVVNGDDIDSWTFSDDVDTAEGNRRRSVARAFLQRMMLF